MADESEKNEEQEKGTAHPESPEQAQEAQAENMDEKYAKLEKDHLYLRAELENIKRQNIKERSQLLKYGAERLARDLLDTVDVLKSALAGEVTAENFQEFVNGVDMTAKSLIEALGKHGITEMECVGKPFDPNTQEALSSEPHEELPEGYVTQVFKAPFQYHDKLLRPGQVIVSRPKSE